MPHIDTLAAAVYELYDVIAELCLHNLGDFLRVGEVEGHIGKSGVERSPGRIAYLTALAG